MELFLMTLTSGIMVGGIYALVALGWVLVPAADRVFGWWLYPGGRSRRVATALGVVAVFGLYGVSLVLARPEVAGA